MGTDAQQYTLDVVAAKLDMACSALLARKRELEAHTSEDFKHQLDIIMLRLDTLVKTKICLIEPLKNLYVYIADGSDVIQPGDLSAAGEENDKLFIKKILQGL
ncbi:hypothetical protein OKW12_001206 [Pseudomonas silensiensis]|nr:hypothetical protein [Pseudomonas silensiensis]